MEEPREVSRIDNEEVKVPAMIRSSIIRSSKEVEERDGSCFDILPSPASLLREQCLICMEKYPSKEMMTLSQCGHHFCTSCLQGYLFYKVEVMERPRCPEEGCPHPMGSD